MVILGPQEDSISVFPGRCGFPPGMGAGRGWSCVMLGEVCSFSTGLKFCKNFGGRGFLEAQPRLGIAGTQVLSVGSEPRGH